jgi:hypothetical protein
MINLSNYVSVIQVENLLNANAGLSVRDLDNSHGRNCKSLMDCYAGSFIDEGQFRVPTIQLKVEIKLRDGILTRKQKLDECFNVRRGKSNFGLLSSRKLPLIVALLIRAFVI